MMKTKLKVCVIPVLEDNFAYLIYDEEDGVGALIDPVEVDKVFQVVQSLGVHVSHILTTHSHWDHAGGNVEMHKRLIDTQQGAYTVEVVGGMNDGVQGVTREVSHDEIIQIGSFQVRVLYTPCHTPGHVLYFCDGNLFTGDTLFVAGCGNFNSGTPEQMDKALNYYIAKLPLDTRVYCGHEYAEKNLRFALEVEPHNVDVQKKLRRIKEQLLIGKHSVPSTVEEELKSNPFMRLNQESVMAYTKTTNPIDTIVVLRKIKTAWGRNN